MIRFFAKENYLFINFVAKNLIVFFMSRPFVIFLLLITAASCTPANYLKLDILNPAEYTITDSGNIAVLNASYHPSAMHEKSNLMSRMRDSEKLIFDTLIMANLFNGLFSALSESPVESLQNAEYYESRTRDTTNFLFPLAPEEVARICRDNHAGYVVSMEYYSFSSKSTREIINYSGWVNNLDVSYKLVWRIYGKDGTVLTEVNDSSTLYWQADSYTEPNPELTDAVREVFFLAGEKFGKKISPFWSVLSRSYFQMYSFGEDISFDREPLALLTTGKKRITAFKACYNLAVLSESEDKLEEALNWLDKAEEIKESVYVDIYRYKLQSRLEVREKLDYQLGSN